MKRILALVLVCLPAFADDAAVDALIDRLASEDPAARQSAFDDLVKLGAAAEPRLKAKREAKDPESRALIEKALVEISLEPLKNAKLTRGPSVIVGGGVTQSGCWSADGNLLATGGEAGDVVVWDARKRVQLRTMTGHTHWVGAVGFTPDGKQLWSAGRTVIVWDVEKGAKLHEFTANRTTHLAVSPDGRWGAWDEHGGIVVVADAKTFEEKGRFSVAGDRTVPEAIAFSPDGKKMAVGNRGSRVRTWDVESGKMLSEEQLPPKEYGSIQEVAFLPGDQLFIAGWEGVLRVGEKKLSLGKGVYTAAANADASRIATAIPDTGEVVLLDGELKEIARWKAADRTSSVYGWSPDGKTLATDSSTGLRLWSEGKPQDLGGHASPPQAFAFSADSRRLAVCSAKQTVFLDVASAEVKRLDAEGFCATGTNGPEVVISRRGRVALWNAEKGEESKLLREFPEGAASEFISLSPDGKFLFRSGFSLAPQFLSIQDAALLTLPEDFHEEARDATWSPDSKRIAVAGVSGMHHEFGGLTILGADGKIIRERKAKGGAFTAAWAPDGKTVWWSDREALRALNVETGEEEEVFKGLIAWWRFLDAATALAYDGQKLSLWHVPTRRQMKAFEESAGYRGVEVSPDGRRVAFADATGATIFELSR